jgi:hypothetical protein
MNSLILRLSGLLSVVMLVTLASCDKDDPATSKETFVFGKTWIVVKYELDGVDITDDRDECETDNTTTFNSDGTYKDAIGSLKCDEFETDTDGTWTFKANETILSIHPAGEDPSDWNILELSDKTMKLSQYVQMLGAEVVVVMAPL